MKKLLIYTTVALLGIASVTAQTFDKNVMPKPAKTPSINIKKPETFTLNNGLKVMIVENHKLPKVDVSLVSDQIPFYEGDVVGVSQIMADQLGKGTQHISKDEFNKRVDFLGASLNFDSQSASANMLSKYFKDIINLMTDAILYPKFDDTEVEKSKLHLVEVLKSQEKSSKAITNQVYNALVYGKNTAFGEFPTKESIEKINTTDVEKEFYKRFSPENYYLVIVGDVTTKQVKEALKNGLENWKKTSLDKRGFTNPKNLQQIEIDVVDIPNAVQSEIRVGNLHKISLKDKNFFASKIANLILGGSGTGTRLNANLREDKAFTYGAYSSLQTGKYNKNFMIATQVRNTVTAQAIKEIIKEVKNISTITEKELKDTKELYKGNFIMTLEQPSTIAGFAVSKEKYNLPEDYYKNYLKHIDAVTVDDVKNAVKEFIKPQNLRIFIAGKTADFLPELEKLGYPIKFYDKNANPTSKPKQKKIEANVTVESIRENYIKSIGGREAIKQISSIKTIAVANMQGMEITATTILENGSKTMVDITLMGQTMQKIVFNGKEGYILTSGQKSTIPKDVADEIKQNKLIFPELEKNTKTMKLKGIETIKDEETYAVENGSITSFYSVKTGLKLAEVKTQKVQGKDISVPTYFSDYKTVNTVKTPHKITQLMGGQEIIFNVKNVEFNTAKPQDFN